MRWRAEPIRPLRTAARYRPISTRPASVLPRRFPAHDELRLHRIPWCWRLRLPASPAVKLFGRPALTSPLETDADLAAAVAPEPCDKHCVRYIASPSDSRH